MRLINLKGKIQTFKDLQDWVNDHQQNLSLNHYEIIALDWLYVHHKPEDNLDNAFIELHEFSNETGSTYITSYPAFDGTGISV